MIDRRNAIEALLEHFYGIKRKIAEGHGTARNPLPVTPSQGFALFFVAKQGMSGVKEIAKVLQVTSSAASQLVDELVRKGYLLRKTNDQDRRAVTVTLSASAKRKTETLRIQAVKKMSALLAALSEKELKEYCRLNKKIAESLTS